MQISEKNIRVLNFTPLFNGITLEETMSLLHCLSYRIKKFEKNTIILRQGDIPKDAALVLSGSVHLITEDFWGNRTILSDIPEGSIFAETFAFEGNKPLTVSALAAADAEILFFSVNKILTVCSSACVFHTRIIRNFVQVLALKNIMLNRKLLYLSFRSTREKLLSYLSDQAEIGKSEKFMIPFSRQELADFLCVDRSAMSCEISKLQKEGILETNKNEFILFSKNGRKMLDGKAVLQ